MTRNQQRARELAGAIIRGTIDAIGLSEPDWHLLLLAAGLNKALSEPLQVCRRILDQAERRAGYFHAIKRPIKNGDGFSSSIHSRRTLFAEAAVSMSQMLPAD